MRDVPEFYDACAVMALRSYTADMFGRFLRFRGIDQKFELEEFRSSLSGMWPWAASIPQKALVYRFRGLCPCPTQVAEKRDYLHGSFFHTMWQIAHAAMFMDSCSTSEGHEFSTPGVYMTDSWEHALHYGWATQLFRDGLFYRMMWVVQADYQHKRHEKKKGFSGGLRVR